MAETATKKPPRSSTAMGKHAGAEAQRRATGNWQRAEYVRSRGHRTYVTQARRCERFYLGAGLQWEQADKETLAETGRKPVEDNQIMQMVNTAIGYQIANRMDIAVRPRGRGADDQSAKVMGMTLKYIADDTGLHWKETLVFGDGMIQQRGYFDVRMSFEHNIYGEVDTSVLDPLDVMPDPDARSYDPDDWADVTIDRWYSLDGIEQLFGLAARRALELHGQPDPMMQATYDGDAGVRNRFGGEGSAEVLYAAAASTDGVSPLYHVVDRQYRTYELVQCAIWPTGDIRPVPDASPEKLEAYKAQGATIVKRMHKRIRWLVSTNTVVLFDDHSPYPWFTVVPFFPFFRRGITRGMVDNAISPQECLNKGLSQLGHILNTVANSGWLVEAGSLVDITPSELEQKAAKNGLILTYKHGTTKPEKIQPSQVPSGIVEYIAQSRASLVASTGIDEALTSSGPMNEMSGVAYQARQYAAQQKLAVPLDNLGRTRHMVARRYIDLTQMYFDTPRLLRITEQDDYGDETTTELSVNEPTMREDGEVDYLNDLTLGEYDFVISEQPMAVTFDNSQFEQTKSLAKDFGYIVPPAIALRYTALADKAEIAKAIEAASSQQPDPEVEAKVRLMDAQIEKLVTETINKRIEAVYGATQAGTQIATIPQVAGLADEILQSAGFVDQNSAPIIPQDQVGAGLALAAPAVPIVEPAAAGADLNGPAPANSNPMTPANPGVGLNEGIEAPGAQ